ncbi:MAG: PAS domain S-box protein [Deltaproteobacteria bacterium]|nr:PAS domain S-box protein [Deltaproteobacteria bacterium]
MTDRHKSREELLQELRELRRRVARLENCEQARLRSEKKLQERERFFSHILNSIQDGVSILDRELNILQVNDTIRKWYAHRTTFEGSKCYQVYHGRSEPCVICPTLITLRKGVSGREIVPKKGRKGETVGWLDLFSFPIVNGATGEVEAVVEYVRDITDRKKTEEALLESEERFRNLLEHIPGVSIQGYSTDGTVLYWNKASEQVYGYTAAEAVGKNLADLIIPPDIRPSFQEGLRIGAKATESGELMPGGEYMLLHKNGSLVPVYSIHTVVCLGNRPNTMFCIDVDLSERKQAEEALKKAYAELEQRVQERTAALLILNEKLRHEIEERKQVEEELRRRETDLGMRTRELEEVNSALRVLLRQREEDKRQVEAKFMMNSKHLLLPYIDKLKKSNLRPEQMTLASLLESYVKEIISPLTMKLSYMSSYLTPTELKLANLIRDGKTSKEIAALLNLSENTVQTHRYHLRSKLGIKQKKINLRSYLQSISK